MSEFEPSPEFNGEWEYPWQQDAEGYYLNLRTEIGVFELRPYNTYIFLPEDPQHERLTHVYRITEENEDSLDGFYMWRELFARVGKDLDTFIVELQAHGFETIEFDELEDSDLRAWEKTHGHSYEPATPPVPTEDEQIIDAIKDLDAKWYWFEGEWNEQT